MSISATYQVVKYPFHAAGTLFRIWFTEAIELSFMYDREAISEMNFIFMDLIDM